MTAALLATALAAALTTVVSSPAEALTYNVALSLQPTAIQAATSQTTTATVTVTYQGQGVPNQWVSFSSSGDATPLQSECITVGTGNAGGTCSVQFRAGTTYGSQTITAQIDQARSGAVVTGSGTASLFQYYPPTSITETLSATTQQADGISPVVATATLKDAQGRGVASEPVTFSSNDAGIAVGPVTDHGDGTYTSSLSAPPPNTTTSSFSDTVTAALTSAGLSASGTVTYTNPPPRVAGPLSAPGTQILDKFGTPVVLRGINAVNYIVNPQTSADPTGFYGSSDPGMLRPAAVGNLYLWGANFVRLDLTSDLYLQNCPGETYPVTKSQYAADLQKEVNLITSYGIVVLLSLGGSNPNCHWAPTSNGQYGVSPPLPSKADATAFFAALGAQFASNNLVAYELYNEPWVCGSGSPQTDTSSLAGCSSQDAANHGWAQDGTLTFNDSNGQAVSYPAAGMSTIYNAVRQNAPSQLVFVDANGFAGDTGSFDTVCATATPGCLWQGPTNLVYVFHLYECQDQSGNQPLTLAVCSGPTPEKSSTISGDIAWKLADHANGGAAWPRPVHFDEFGWPQNEAKYQYNVSTPAGQVPMQITPYGHGLFVNNAITYFDSRGIGWALYAYGNDSDPVWQGPFTNESTTKTVPWTPNADGQPAVNSMQGKPMAYQDPPAGYG